MAKDKKADAEPESASMRRVLIDVILDQHLVRIEAWDDEDKHYLGNANEDQAKTLMSAVFKKLNRAFPKEITLLVRKFEILKEQ